MRAVAGEPSGQVPTHVWKGDLLRVDHAAIRVPDLDQAIRWYQLVLGVVEVERVKRRVYFASPVSGRIVLALTEGGTGLDYVSFVADGASALKRLGALADRNKIRADLGHADSRPGARGALRMTLPTEHVVELLDAEDVASSTSKLAPSSPGAFDIRSSHIQLRTPDVVGTARYLDAIGFKVTDFAKLPDTSFLAQFVRINEFHHQVALFAGRAGLHHVALEIDSIDFLKIGDHLARHRIAAEYGPGRHEPGNSIFFYIRDPFGNRIELGSPMLMVGFDHAARELTDAFPYLVNMWGPQPPDTWHNEWT